MSWASPTLLCDDFLLLFFSLCKRKIESKLRVLSCNNNGTVRLTTDKKQFFTFQFRYICNSFFSLNLGKYSYSKSWSEISDRYSTRRRIHIYMHQLNNLLVNSYSIIISSEFNFHFDGFVSVCSRFVFLWLMLLLLLQLHFDLCILLSMHIFLKLRMQSINFIETKGKMLLCRQFPMKI